jgi:hypothetical protein
MKKTSTTANNLIDRLDEFYLNSSNNTNTNNASLLIDSDDEFDEDIVLYDYDCTTCHNTVPITDGTSTTNNIKTFVYGDVTTAKTPSIFTQIKTGISNGAEMLSSTVVNGVQVTATTSLSITKSTLTISKDVIQFGINQIVQHTSGAAGNINIEQNELIDDMQSVLLTTKGAILEEEEEEEGFTIDSIILNNNNNNNNKSNKNNNSNNNNTMTMKCSYLQKKLCSSCFSNENKQHAIIPSDVFNRWDFTKKIVCNKAFEFLENTFNEPVISLRKLNEMNKYYYSTSIASREEFNRLRAFLDLQVKVATLFQRVSEKLNANNNNNNNNNNNINNNNNNDNNKNTKNSNQQKQQQLLHFLASIPEDKRRLVRLGDEAKVSIRELQEFHEKRRQSSIVEYLSAIETEVNDVLL